MGTFRILAIVPITADVDGPYHKAAGKNLALVGVAAEEERAAIVVLRDHCRVVVEDNQRPSGVWISLQKLVGIAT